MYFEECLKIIIKLSALLVTIRATSGQKESYGLSYLAEHLNKYCRISSPRNCDCEGHPEQPSNSELRVGKAGPQGPPGPSGIVDYDAIDEKIEAKLTEYVGVLEKLRDMEQFMRNVKLGRCQVIYNEKCFWFIYRRVNYDQARDLCLEVNATPANLYDKDHYRMLRKLVRNNRGVTTEPWLGMTYSFQTKTAAYYNGTGVQFAIPWHPGYPANVPGQTQLNLSVRQDASHSFQGIWDAPPSSKEDGVICEI